MENKLFSYSFRRTLNWFILSVQVMYMHILSEINRFNLHVSFWDEIAWNVCNTLILRGWFSAIGMLLATDILCPEGTSYFPSPMFDRFYWWKADLRIRQCLSKLGFCLEHWTHQILKVKFNLHLIFDVIQYVAYWHTLKNQAFTFNDCIKQLI